MAFEVITTAPTDAPDSFKRQSTDYPTLDEAKAALNRAPEQHRVGIWSRETGRCVWPSDKAEEGAEPADNTQAIQDRDNRLQSPASKAAHDSARSSTGINAGVRGYAEWLKNPQDQQQSA